MSLDASGSRLEWFSTREVVDLVDLSEGQIRRYARSGVVSPRRGPRGAYRFDFRDVVMLRLAHELGERLDSKKAHQALRQLIQQLPDDAEPTGVKIEIIDREVMARDGASVWDLTTGQTVFDFVSSDGHGRDGGVSRLEPRSPRRIVRSCRLAEQWFRAGLDLEDESPDEAVKAYLQALNHMGDHPDVCVSLGRLLIIQGDPRLALEVLRKALRIRPDDPNGLFSLGEALESLERPREALRVYERCARVWSNHPTAHDRAARLCEHFGDEVGVARHRRAARGTRR